MRLTNQIAAIPLACPAPSEKKAGCTMDGKLAHIDTTLARIALLAEALKADPDGHVRRSIEELRAAFDGREAIEPAVTRVRASVKMLRMGNHEGSRREFQRRAPGLDQLCALVEQELLPDLRGLGFDV
jgi:hypothetical protein